jgi:hypothetical protein
LNESIAEQILTSNPNFNYLYSNISSEYTEPLTLLTIAKVSQSIINVLYGSELELIDLNKHTNQIDKSKWIREQMCSNENFLLRLSHKDQTKVLNSFLCANLTDEKLVELFTLISQEIEWNTVKRKVFFTPHIYLIKILEN